MKRLIRNSVIAAVRLLIVLFFVLTSGLSGDAIALSSPLVKASEDFYLTYSDHFINLDNWEPTNLIVTFPSSTTVKLTVAETATWGKIERKPLAYIPVDLYNFPILRVNVPEISGDAKWKINLHKTTPTWQEFELQPVTAKTGVYDYNLPDITGWNGNQRLQVILVVEGTATGSVTFDSIQLGSYTKPPEPPAPTYKLFSRINASLGASANTYHFTASGEKVYSDNQSEPYTWDTFSWDFGDGTTGSGQEITHSYTSEGLYHVMLTASDAQGNEEYAFKEIGATKSLYADYFVGYRSRQFSGRSDIWWYYDTETCSWVARPADLYEPGSSTKKQTISFYTPEIGYYDQWDPATIEYSILLSKMVGIDGFAFEYQDNDLSPAASLMPKFLPYAQKYDFKMTAQWVPATMYDWYKDEVASRADMVSMGQEVIENLTQNYILPSGATYRVGGIDRPVWFLFNWDPHQNHLDYVLTDDPGGFGYTKDEITQLRNYASSLPGATNPILLAAAWSYLPYKWNVDSGDPFPLAGVVDGMYGWPNPAFEKMPDNHPYYNNHPYLGPDIDYLGPVDRNLAYFDKEYAESARLMGTGEFLVKSGTAFPGFDDPYNGAWGECKRRYIPQEDDNGYTIDQTFDRFITNQIDIGLFATFGDWAESTTLEPTLKPTQELGYDIAIRSAKKIAEWKGLPIPSDEFLNSYLPFVVDIYNLRQNYKFLQQVGYNDIELKPFKQAIDAIIPAVLARDINTAQTWKDVAQKLYASLLNEPYGLTLEWVDESQGASLSAGSLPLTMNETRNSQSFSFPLPVRTLLDSGAYTGKVIFEYQDAGTTYMVASVNTLADFGVSSNETTEILKLKKTNSEQWQTAQADFVNASFHVRFNDRSDITFQTQGSLAYVNNFTHTANALTVGYWVKPDLLTSGIQNQVLMINPESGEETLVARINNFYNGVSTPGLLEAYVNLGSGIQTITVPNAFTPGNWTHVGIVWDGASNQLKVYLDGTLRSISQASTGILAATTRQILVGTVTNGLDGAIDDLQIYDRALSGADVGRLAGGESLTEGPKGYWKFDEGKGRTVKDISGNKHPANLYNGSGWAADALLSTDEEKASLKLTGDSAGTALRSVKIELKAYQPPYILLEDFSDLREWVAWQANLSTDGQKATLTVDPGYSWGKMERLNPTYLITVNLDQYPILGTIITSTTGTWRLFVLDANDNWKPFELQPITSKTGLLEYNIPELTGLSGLKTLQVQYVIEGAGKSLTVDELRFCQVHCWERIFLPMIFNNWPLDPDSVILSR